MTVEKVYSSIKDWTEDEQPREKLIRHGRQVLSDAELIAILMGSGTKRKSAVDVARELMPNAQNNINVLARMSIKDLCKVSGIGPAKAVSIIAAMELSQRRNVFDQIQVKKIQSSKDAYRQLKPHLQDLNYEQFWIITVARNNSVINLHKVSDGGISGTLADPKRIFKLSLEDYASGIILAHNHPSGNLIPSSQDKKLTIKMKEAGKALEINILDHLIITQSSYLSFMDEGVLD